MMEREENALFVASDKSARAICVHLFAHRAPGRGMQFDYVARHCRMSQHDIAAIWSAPRDHSGFSSHAHAQSMTVMLFIDALLTSDVLSVLGDDRLPQNGSS